MNNHIYTIHHAQTQIIFWYFQHDVLYSSHSPISDKSHVKSKILQPVVGSEVTGLTAARNQIAETGSILCSVHYFLKFYSTVKALDMIFG